MTARIERHVAGDLVLHELMDVSPNRLTTKELAQRTGLTPSQVANGLLWVREKSAAQLGVPLTYSHRGGWGLTPAQPECISYEVSKLRAMFASSKLLISGTIDPHSQLFPNDRIARLYSQRLGAMAAELDFLIDAGGGAYG